MSNKFAQTYVQRINDSYHRGFTCGLGLVLLGYYNKVDDYIEDPEKQRAFFQEWETEVNRIIQEEMHGNVMDSAEVIAFHIEEIRKKWNIRDPKEVFDEQRAILASHEQT